MQIKAGDTVVVIAGKDKFTKDKKGNLTPTTGKVLKVYPATNKVVVVPLEIYSLDLSQPDAIARVRLDAKSLCGEAAAAAGAPSPPEDAEEYEPPNDEAHHWSAECSSVVLIYKINPSSKFDDW